MTTFLVVFLCAAANWKWSIQNKYVSALGLALPKRRQQLLSAVYDSQGTP
jgi:hypothetical protein